MAHLTDQPYLNSSNIMPLLNDLAQSVINTYNGVPAEISILVVGGSALALKYNLRGTVDIDAEVRFTGKIKSCIEAVSAYRNIPKDWINEDFMKSESYSRRLWNNAVFMTTLYDYMHVYVVSDLDQLCMKVTSGRRKDFADIDFLLSVLINNGCTYRMFHNEYELLYGDYVKPNLRALQRVQKTFKKNKML